MGTVLSDDVPAPGHKAWWKSRHASGGRVNSSADAAQCRVPGGRDGTRRITTSQGSGARPGCQARAPAHCPDFILQLPPRHSPLPLSGRRGQREPLRLPRRSRGFEERGRKGPHSWTSLAAETPLARAREKAGCTAGHGGGGPHCRCTRSAEPCPAACGKHQS